MHDLVDEVLDPRAFFVAPGATLRIQRSERQWDVVPDDVALVTVHIDSGGTLAVSRQLELRGQGWIREHVGTIDRGTRDPKKALAECVRMALAGTSRLGITSI